MKKLNTKQFKNKKRFAIISIFAVLLIFGIINFNLLPASLYGGNPVNEFGGNFTSSQSGLSGETITNFAECNVEQLIINITNNEASTPSFTPPSYENYKQVAVTITSSADVTNYAVKIPVNHVVEMESDLSDIRFYLEDGTELTQHRESYITDTSAIYWIKTDLLIGDNTIYMKYGNGIPLKDEPASVFNEYFDKNSIDGWTKSGITVTTEGDYLRFYNPTTSTSGHATRYGLALPTKYIMEVQYKLNPLGSNDRCLFITLDGSTSHRKSFTTLPDISDQNNWFYYKNSAYNLVGSYTEGTEYIHKHINDDSDSSTGTNYYLYDLEGNLLSSATSQPASLGTPTDTDGLWIGDISTGAVCDARIKYMRFREYIPSEPIISFGTPTSTTLPEFTKRKTVTIDNTGKSALSGYQWKESIVYDSDMDSNFADIIVTETDGTMVSHFTDNAIASTSADIWFPITVGTDTTKEYYVYYGCPEYEDSSDSSIFPVYDDFNDGVYTDKWDADIRTGAGSASVTETNGYLQLYAACSAVGTSPYASIWTKSALPDGQYVFEGSANGASTNEYKSIEMYSIYLLNGGIGQYTDYTFGFLNLRDTNTLYVDDTVATSVGVTCSETWTSYNDIEFIHTPTLTKYTIGTTSSSMTPSVDITTAPYLRILTYHVDGQSGYSQNRWDWIRARQYTATPPTSTISSETTLGNPTITVSCTGDGDSQSYELETKSITLNPSGAISQFTIDGSANYEFDATIYYTGDVVVVENATAGTMNITFTPEVLIEEGYVNGLFTENITIENYIISATLDDVSTENVILENNNTISVELINCDATEHIVSITITEQTEEDTPVVPSSSGGGGSTYVPPVVEEETINETETISQVSEQLDKEEIIDLLNDNTQAYLILFTLIAVAILAYAMYRMNK